MRDGVTLVLGVGVVCGDEFFDVGSAHEVEEAVDDDDGDGGLGAGVDEGEVEAEDEGVEHFLA